MATSFTIRTANKTGRSTVIARVQRPETSTDLRLSTHLQVDIERWRGASSNASKLRNYRKYESDLWGKLDKIRNSLDVASESGLTSDEARAIIDGIVRKEEIEEMKAREEARKRRDEENSFVDFYRAFISEAEAGKAKRIGKGKGGNLGTRTVINYKQGLKWLEEYRENRLNGRGISFDDLNQAFSDDYQAYLESRELLRGKFKGQTGCRNNTVVMRLAELKSVIRRAEKSGVPVRSDYSSIDILKDTDVDSIALTRNELDAI